MAANQLANGLLARLHQQAREWRVIISHSFETESSVISFVERDDENLVLKLVKQQGDEWNAGEVLRAFNGNGFVRVREHTAGAMLLERLNPATALALHDDDEEATHLLAGVISKIAPTETPASCPAVEDWARVFDLYLSGSDMRIPTALVESAQQLFADLCATQGKRRLLHGDLHHYNVLLDSERGWLAIDPKGVVAELEYEFGAAFRNPFERPRLFLSPNTIRRRLKQFVNELGVDEERTITWAFAQAVLSAVWLIEDGHEVSSSTPTLLLADAIRREFHL
jgi:streptomycin 6-kinase